MTTITATEIWHGGPETVVEVRTTKCSYRVSFHGDDVCIVAPGLEFNMELDESFYPLEEAEVCAIMLVAQIEGGIKL